MKRLLTYILIIIVVLNISVPSFSSELRRDYTVDDLRDLIGKMRIDESYSGVEITEILNNYNKIEKHNLYSKMFELGKSIDIDSAVEEEYNNLNSELEKKRNLLLDSFKSGLSANEVLSIKLDIENILYKISKLRETGITFEVEYIPNTWSEAYNKVQEMLSDVKKDYVIGVIGEGLRSPVLTGFYITSPFGWRIDPYNSDELQYHNGIDLWANESDLVVSQWNGVVTNIYNSETGGNTVEVTHGEGLKTYYLHLVSVDVVIGQELKQYDVIGGAGSTGTRSTGVHLHFAVSLDGEYINPLYLYGNMGLSAFKTYLSNYPDRYRELFEFEGSLKLAPDKVKEDSVTENVLNPRYGEETEGSIKTNIVGNDSKPVPFDLELWYNNIGILKKVDKSTVEGVEEEVLMPKE